MEIPVFSTACLSDLTRFEAMIVHVVRRDSVSLGNQLLTQYDKENGYDSTDTAITAV